MIHGGDLTSYRQQFPNRSVLDFSASINPLGLPDGVKAALTGSLEEITHYPDPQSRELRRALARYEDIPADWILCGNGASDLIFRIAWSLRPASALLLAPTFTEYEEALAATGCAVRHHQLAEERGFILDETILSQIAGNDLVFLCNPNNPTGSLIDPALMDAILTRCRETGTVLVVDECFLDFHPDCREHTMKRQLGDADNLLILRAFTKIFAMPGLRLGYMLGSDPALLARIEAAGPTWNVSVPAQLCGVAATGELAYLAETRMRILQWRAELTRGLADLGCQVYPSEANFLLFRNQPGLAADLGHKGILIRECGSFRGLTGEYYRVAVRTPAENAQLLAAMSAKEEADR